MPLLLKNKRSLLFVTIGILILALVPLAFPTYWIQMLSQVLVVALFAMSLNMEMGHAGMLPLGQSAFYGLGAYAYAIMALKVHQPMWIAVIASLGICFIVNLVCGYLCLRGQFFTFGILHMGFNLLFAQIITKWSSVTGGDSGLAGAPRPEIVASPLTFYFMLLGIVLICVLLIWIIQNSPFGRMMRGLRENEERLRFLGVNTKNYSLVLFILAGMFSGIAGILLAMLNRGAFPTYISLLASAQAMMMCIIGGMYTFLGPCLGAAIIVIFSNTISNYTKQWQALLGVIMIIAVLYFRGGVLRARKITIGSKGLVKATVKEKAGMSSGEMIK
jgi:branched-chain amino acid transport system permease protein